MSSTALDDARARSQAQGGTIGEQLVVAGDIEDDDLTDFYRSRLLVPQVNPNTLARLPVKVVAAIPSDMAIELRAIPVALDHENNLTVAMSDPSDRHAVDEIAFFTGAYVVRAVATQMQIAWCLAHYYGHLTALGHRLIQEAVEPPEPAPAPVAPVQRAPRVKGLTGRVDASRHRAIAPITGPVDIVRPNSGQLDLPPDAVAPATPAAPPVRVPDDEDTDPGAKPRARSISGEIRVPSRRAPSIKPPVPEAYGGDDDDDDESGPIITMEADESPEPDKDPTGPLKMAGRRRKVKSDPPELAARAGEVETASGPLRSVDDEPRIIIGDELDPRAALQPAASGELRVTTKRNDTTAPVTTIEVDESNGAVMIHEHPAHDSEPVLLERRRPSDQPPVAQPRAFGPTLPEDDEVVVLEPRARKPSKPRPVKLTQVGIGALPAITRIHRDTETGGGVPDEVDDAPTRAEPALDADHTEVEPRAAPATEDTTDESLVAPPSPEDTDSHVAAPPSPRRATSVPPAPFPRAESPPVGAHRRASSDDGHPTSVMSAVELDEAIPERADVVVPAHLDDRRVDYDPVDDGWGPPGTTIPPPLLGAVPGSEDEDAVAGIPLDVDSAPLIVAPPAPPQASRSRPAMSSSGDSLVRALEEATSRSIGLINALEHAPDRNAIIGLMIDHLAESHVRAGFFAVRPDANKVNELVVFAMQPNPVSPPAASLRLDRPSTLQDVVGTRLPYRGAMHDDASRTFLSSILGACPAEILLVPIAIRERVVGVLFGDHRVVHTFDDQLSVAARAAGMALERVLKAKR